MKGKKSSSRLRSGRKMTQEVQRKTRKSPVKKSKRVNNSKVAVAEVSVNKEDNELGVQLLDDAEEIRNNSDDPSPAQDSETTGKAAPLPAKGAEKRSPRFSRARRQQQPVRIADHESDKIEDFSDNQEVSGSDTDGSESMLKSLDESKTPTIQSRQKNDPKVANSNEDDRSDASHGSGTSVDMFPELANKGTCDEFEQSPTRVKSRETSEVGSEVNNNWEDNSENVDHETGDKKENGSPQSIDKTPEPRDDIEEGQVEFKKKLCFVHEGRDVCEVIIMLLDITEKLRDVYEGGCMYADGELLELDRRNLVGLFDMKETGKEMVRTKDSAPDDSEKGNDDGRKKGTSSDEGIDSDLEKNKKVRRSRKGCGATTVVEKRTQEWRSKQTTSDDESYASLSSVIEENHQTRKSRIRESLTTQAEDGNGMKIAKKTRKRTSELSVKETSDEDSKSDEGQQRLTRKSLRKVTDSDQDSNSDAEVVSVTNDDDSLQDSESDEEVVTPKRSPRKSKGTTSSKRGEVKQRLTRNSQRKVTDSDQDSESDEEVMTPKRSPRKSKGTASSKRGEVKQRLTRNSQRKVTDSDQDSESDEEVVTPKRSPRKSKGTTSSKRGEVKQRLTRNSQRKVTDSDQVLDSDEEVVTPKRSPRKSKGTTSSKRGEAKQRLTRKSQRKVADFNQDLDSDEEVVTPKRSRGKSKGLASSISSDETSSTEESEASESDSDRVSYSASDTGSSISDKLRPRMVQVMSSTNSESSGNSELEEEDGNLTWCPKVDPRWDFRKRKMPLRKRSDISRKRVARMCRDSSSDESDSDSSSLSDNSVVM